MLAWVVRTINFLIGSDSWPPNGIFNTSSLEPFSSAVPPPFPPAIV
jgi:hypothetical protein